MSNVSVATIRYGTTMDVDREARQCILNVAEGGK